MYNSITGTGAGTAPVVNIPWPFLDQDHVNATVDGSPVSLTWTGASQVTFAEAVDAGADWEVFRDTPVTPLVGYTNGAVLTAGDLVLAQNQALYRLEELQQPTVNGTPLAASSGAGLIGWIAAGIGAVVRNVRDKLREQPASIVDYGGVDGEDSLDALNAMIAEGITDIYLPEGDFHLSDTPDQITGSIKIAGPGRLIIDHVNSPALDIEPASVNDKVELDFEMVANATAGPCPLGVQLTFPSGTTSYPYRQARLNVRFRGDLGTSSPTWAKSWGRGYKLSNLWYPEITGYGSSAPIAGDTGNTGFIEVAGGSYGMVGAQIMASWYFGADFLRGSAYTEGLYVREGSEAVGVTRGVYVPATTPNGGLAGLFRAQALKLHGHIAAHTAGVDLDNVFDLETDVNNQRWADASATNWTAYKLNNVQAVNIQGTMAGNDASGGVTTLGISATGANSSHGRVNARFENLDTQFNLAAATSHWKIRGLSTGSTPDVYVLSGTNHDVEWLTSAGIAQRNVTGLSINLSALGNYADDAAASAGGVAVGQFYRNGSVIMVRAA